MTSHADEDERFMARALELAARGEGCVEPNPMVGCVLVRDGQVVGEGWHAEFGGPHAEIVALREAAASAAGATVYVTLEPCCHQGKTAACTKALIHARVARVVAAMEDPFPPVDGGGIQELTAAGIDCSIGMLGEQVRTLNAPYLKRLSTGRPWVIAKWAMTLDGKLAAAGGHKTWISNEASRAVVHQLRGRVDAIIVGRGTARADDPLLTARPHDPADRKRIATRVVVDSNASLALESQLVKTARDVPVLVVVSAAAPVERCRQLVAAGVDVFPCAGTNYAERFDALLDELGRRKMTNVLVEGGGRLLGTILESGAVDEVHVFIAPMVGGRVSVARSPWSARLKGVTTAELDGDLYVRGRVSR